MMNGPELITMGCRLNIAESEAIKSRLGNRNQQDDDLIIVNSCAVTNEAVRQTRQAIRRAKKAAPEKRVVVTGCAAQIDPDMFAEMPETSAVIGNFDKYDVRNFLDFDADLTGTREMPPNKKLKVSDIMAVRETAPHMVASFADRSRAFVEIQNGCDHRCTFCIIPYGRGNSRSVPAGQLIDHITALTAQGFEEIVLTGVDVTSYGYDLPGQPSLGQLIERILKYVPALPRLRLSSLDGIEIDERLLELLTGEDRIMPHIHLSLQSGDDMILKRMKRRHSRRQAAELVQKLKKRRPEIAIGADIIVGFPTETPDMFEASVKLIADCDIVHGHVFPYSPKKGTPAEKMPQVDRNDIKIRARRLRNTVKRHHEKWLQSLIHTKQKIILEQDGRSGYSENFAKVVIPDNQARPKKAGKIVDVYINTMAGSRLMGTLAR